MIFDLACLALGIFVTAVALVIVLAYEQWMKEDGRVERDEQPRIHPHPGPYDWDA